MDYEKAYKASLKTAAQWIKDGCTDKEKICLKCVFPALRESEDERIRKLLVWQVYRNIEDETNDLAQSVYDGIKGHDPDIEESIEDWKKCLAYLEKQKDSKVCEEKSKNFTIQKEQKKDNPFEDFLRGYDAGYLHGIDDRVNKKVKPPVEWLKRKKEQKLDTIDADDVQLLGFIYDLLNEIEWKDNWAMSKDECLRRLNNYRPQKPVEGTALQKAFISSKIDYTLEEKCDASDYAEAILPTSVVYGENEEEYKLHKIIEAAFIAGQKKEQNPTEWSDTNELVFKDICKHLKEEGYNGWIVLLEALRNGEFQPKQKWSEEGEMYLSQAIETLEHENHLILADKLKSLRPQPQQEWSEEDEKMLAGTLNSLKRYQLSMPNYQVELQMRWLKSLRPSWKPTYEQLEALRKAVNKLADTEVADSVRLSIMYDHLKELV